MISAKHSIVYGMLVSCINLKQLVSQKFLTGVNSIFGQKQRVFLPGDVSNWIFITAGVAQGSILGPLLFLLYITDTIDWIVCR